MPPDKVARANLDPDHIESTSFLITGDYGSRQIEASVLPPSSQLAEADFVVALQTEQDEYGFSWDRYLRLPRSIMESGRVVAEFYESHENLVKGIGGVAVVGSIVVGSLFVLRKPRQDNKV